MVLYVTVYLIYIFGNLMGAFPDVRRCRVQLTPEYSFHMVKIEDKAYMVSAEVSSLLWSDDVIRQKVCKLLSTRECQTVYTDRDDAEFAAFVVDL